VGALGVLVGGTCAGGAVGVAVGGSGVGVAVAVLVGAGVGVAVDVGVGVSVGREVGVPVGVAVLTGVTSTTTGGVRSAGGNWMGFLGGTKESWKASGTRVAKPTATKIPKTMPPPTSKIGNGLSARWALSLPKTNTMRMPVTTRSRSRANGTLATMRASPSRAKLAMITIKYNANLIT
jgi:hypothetical protein